MDWNSQFKHIIKTPNTIAEAVNYLMNVLDHEQKSIIANKSKDDLIEFHFSLGVAIRNSFDLYNNESKLLKSCESPIHPDDISMKIIIALWEKLNSD